MRLMTFAGAAVLAAVLASCGGQHECPASIPGPSGGAPIPVLLVEDDTGRPVDHVDDVRLGGGGLACEADANRNSVGDEYEVEVLEESLNGGED